MKGIEKITARIAADAEAANSAVRATGIITENGMVDIDTLYNAAMAQLRRQKTLPLDVPLIGRLTFDENDIAELYRTISAS